MELSAELRLLLWPRSKVARVRRLSLSSVAIGAIAVVAVVIVAANIWPPRSTVSMPLPMATPVEPSSPSTAALPVATSDPSVAALPSASQVVDRWPGPRGGPAGIYSWSGALAWMHNATDQGIGVSMLFSSEVMDPGSQTRDDAWTYEALPISADDVQTELWTADFLNRRVTIKVEAQPDITPAELAEAHVIIKSMRSEPTDASPFRLTFTLPGGWDSG